MPTNLSSFFFAVAMTLVAVPSAFAQVTTFNVDMSCAPDFDNVFVTGPWCAWCANDVYNTMTDPDGDGIYSVTLDETVTGTIEYKYAINGWADQENLVNDMIDGASCAPITDFSGYANRQTQQGSINNDSYGTCDGTCNDTPPANVTFHVDMSGYEGQYDPSQVTWNSVANGWCGNCAYMDDPDGDGIYSITVPLEGDSIEYKFAIGAWDDQEDLAPESSCTRTTYDEGAPNGCCYVNRVVSVLGEEPIDLPVVCWNECSSCNLSNASAPIWSNDISNCADWTFGNGSNEAGAPWSGIDLNFECTLDGPTGFFNGWAGGASDGTAAPAMNSTTSFNGLLLLDSDYYGSEAQYDANWIENSWVQTSTPIDCSVNPLVAISFETRYRCWDNGGSDGSEKCFVEISRDGTTWPNLTQAYVTTWQEEGMVAYGSDMVQCRYEVFPESETGFETENPDYREFDITEAAGGQSEVWIRFRWVGTWGYSWEIDDIKVFDIEENDTRIDSYLSYTNYQQTGIYENGAWAQSQLLESLSAGAKVYNFGWGTQENVVLDIEVNGATSSSSIIETFPNAASDTLSADYVVSEVGTYTVNYALTADNVDDNPQNNYASQSFEVTEFSYGRDNGVIVDTYGGDFEYACMPYYDIHNDATIYGIDVAIMDGGEAGSPIRAFVIDLDDPANLGADGFLAPPYDMLPLAESGETYLNPDVSNNGTGEIVWYTFEFEEPLQVTAGQVLGASFEYFGGAALSIAESSTNFDGTAAIYGPSAADGSYAWRGTDEMPMVRLNFDPNLEPTEGEVAVYGCTDPLACNYVPEANVDDGSCCSCSEDSFSTGELLYFENFDSYASGDAISEVSQAFDLWPAEGVTDAYVTNEAQLSGTNSLKIEGQLTGGPMDVVLIAGLEGLYDVTVNLLVPFGYSGYYNVQENVVAGIEWAFECYLGSDSTITFAVDPAADGSGGPEFTTTYNYGAWVEINHVIDTDADLMNVFIDGSWVGELPYDGEQIGGINFFAAGDGVTLPLYYVDDISVTIPASLPGCNLGCTDIAACNYVPSAIADDGSCDYSCFGCTDPSAFNFDPTADVDDGSCTYFEPSCAAIGAPEWEAFGLGLYAPTTLLHMAGQSVTQEVVLHLPASIEEEGTGTTYAVADWSGLEVLGMPAGLAFDNLAGTISGGSQTCLTYSGVPTTAGTYEVTMTGELFLSVFGNPVSAGMVASSFTMVITPNENGILGCTYANASNYLPVATIDDGSCVYAGCMDPEASNFQIFATTDDGSCSYECAAVEGPCMFDSNNDGLIGSGDLLNFLTAYGVSCE